MLYTFSKNKNDAFIPYQHGKKKPYKISILFFKFEKFFTLECLQTYSKQLRLNKIFIA